MTHRIVMPATTRKPICLPVVRARKLLEEKPSGTVDIEDRDFYAVMKLPQDKQAVQLNERIVKRAKARMLYEELLQAGRHLAAFVVDRRRGRLDPVEHELVQTEIIVEVPSEERRKLPWEDWLVVLFCGAAFIALLTAALVTAGRLAYLKGIATDPVMGAIMACPIVFASLICKSYYLRVLTTDAERRGFVRWFCKASTCLALAFVVLWAINFSEGMQGMDDGSMSMLILGAPTEPAGMDMDRILMTVWIGVGVTLEVTITSLVLILGDFMLGKRRDPDFKKPKKRVQLEHESEGIREEIEEAEVEVGRINGRIAVVEVGAEDEGHRAVGEFEEFLLERARDQAQANAPKAISHDPSGRMAVGETHNTNRSHRNGSAHSNGKGRL